MGKLVQRTGAEHARFGPDHARTGPAVQLTFCRCFAHSSFVLCNSACADRIVVAASKLLGAAVACVILLSFAAGPRESYWSVCIKVAIVICQQIFSILELVIFP